MPLPHSPPPSGDDGAKISAKPMSVLSSIFSSRSISRRDAESPGRLLSASQTFYADTPHSSDSDDMSASSAEGSDDENGGGHGYLGSTLLGSCSSADGQSSIEKLYEHQIRANELLQFQVRKVTMSLEDVRRRAGERKRQDAVKRIANFLEFKLLRMGDILRLSYVRVTHRAFLRWFEFACRNALERSRAELRNGKICRMFRLLESSRSDMQVDALRACFGRWRVISLNARDVYFRLRAVFLAVGQIRIRQCFNLWRQSAVKFSRLGCDEKLRSIYKAAALEKVGGIADNFRRSLKVKGMASFRLKLSEGRTKEAGSR